MFVCVDFDGTLVDHRFPEIGPAVPLAFEFLHFFQEAKLRVILWTMRSNDPEIGRWALKEAVDYVEREHNIKFYGVNENSSQAKWTSSPKAYGHFYIDDAAVGCPLIQPEGFRRKCVDWSVVGPYVLRRSVS